MEKLNRKHPVHIQPVIKHNMPVILFITVCSKDKQNIFNNDKFHATAIKSWKEANAWKVGYYIIMPNHIHFFCTPNSSPIYNLKLWIKYWKRIVTQNYDINIHLWEKDFWDTQMRSSDHYLEKLNYARNNPIAKGLINNCDEWIYQGYIHHNLFFG